MYPRAVRAGVSAISAANRRPVGNRTSALRASRTSGRSAPCPSTTAGPSAAPPWSPPGEAAQATAVVQSTAITRTKPRGPRPRRPGRPGARRPFRNSSWLSNRPVIVAPVGTALFRLIPVSNKCCRKTFYVGILFDRRMKGYRSYMEADRSSRARLSEVSPVSVLLPPRRGSWSLARGRRKSSGAHGAARNRRAAACAAPAPTLRPGPDRQQEQRRFRGTGDLSARQPGRGPSPGCVSPHRAFPLYWSLPSSREDVRG
jgi:hypothetical protein